MHVKMEPINFILLFQYLHLKTYSSAAAAASFIMCVWKTKYCHWCPLNLGSCRAVEDPPFGSFRTQDGCIWRSRQNGTALVMRLQPELVHSFYLNLNLHQIAIITRLKKSCSVWEIIPVSICFAHLRDHCWSCICTWNLIKFAGLLVI